LKIWNDAGQDAASYLREPSQTTVRFCRVYTKARQQDIRFFYLSAIRTPNQETTDFYPTNLARVMPIYLNPHEHKEQQIYEEVERIQAV
tara:strand:+ start:567 stop:833 length:267 start_codon:yes stop_codon:yes gene_type:complete